MFAFYNIICSVINADLRLLEEKIFLSSDTGAVKTVNNQRRSSLFTHSEARLLNIKL